MARITIKGIPHEAGIAPEAPLAAVLRDLLGMTGAKSEARKPGTALERAQDGCDAADCHVSGMLHG